MNMLTVLRLIPRRSALFGTMIACVVAILLCTLPVRAQTAPFLITPYYGQKGINSNFDHEFPDYFADGSLVGFNGVRRGPPASATNCTNGINGSCYNGHDGYDFDVQYEHIVAAAAGTVIQSGWQNLNLHQGQNAGFGLYIDIDHGNGYRTRYGHLSSVAVSVGQAVQAGQIIGTGGSTGNSNGAHLHFGVYFLVNGVWQPIDLFGGAAFDPWRDQRGVTSSCLWKDGEWANYCANGVSRPIPAPVNGGETVIDDNATNAGGFSKGSSNSCTGDCGGWTRADNLYWATSSLVVPSSWAKWQPTIPNGGAIYEILVNIPAVNALPDTDAGTTWFAPYTVQYYDGTNIVTSVAYVDQRGSRGRWISIGTYYMISGNWVQLTNASGEAIGSRRLGADSVKFIRRGTTYAPDARYSGWVSTINLRNNGGGPSQMILNFLDSNGNQACSALLTSLASQAMQGYNCLSSSLAAVIVDANQDVSMLTVHQIGSGSSYATEAYPGIDHPAADVHIPIVQKNNSGPNNPNFWNSYIYVQNAGNAATDVAVEFFPVAGSGSYYIYNENNVAPGTVRRIDVSTKSIGLARADYPTVFKFIGAVHLSNPQNQPLAVASTQYQANALLMETSNTQPPATMLYAPLAQNNNAGWLSGLALRSTNGGGNFTVQYYNAGTLCFTEPAVTGNPDPRNIYPAPSGAGCPTTPSVVFQAGAPMVTNVNQLLNATAATTYAAISQPALTAIVPKVFRTSDWGDGFTIMNTGNANATLTVLTIAAGHRPTRLASTVACQPRRNASIALHNTQQF